MTSLDVSQVAQSFSLEAFAALPALAGLAESLLELQPQRRRAHAAGSGDWGGKTRRALFFFGKRGRTGEFYVTLLWKGLIRRSRRC